MRHGFTKDIHHYTIKPCNGEEELGIDVYHKLSLWMKMSYYRITIRTMQ